MHVSGLLRAPLDLNLFFQFIFTALIFAVGLLYLVKNTASKYFIVDGNFDSSSTNSLGNKSNNSFLSSESNMPGFIVNNECIICSNSTTKQCSGCKMVRYCSEACQRSHWNSGHKKMCKNFLLFGKANSMQPGSSVLHGRKLSTSIPLIAASGSSKSFYESKEILFPYEEFVQLFNWEKPGFPPCGLLNCGNSCFANVVLQFLGCTRPLVAYFLEKGHQSECRRNDWCFMCEFQRHVERATRTIQPFSPINILSRLPNIGGNFGYGKQEDAHEFMRFAIDTMQSVCLDEFGGEKAVHPRAQETTFIQHIFGGHLQSQVICTKCNNVSNQFENMMDLTVEIQGDVASLEECLDQFTVKERLHGDNMYKCDGCNDYVLAWKRLTIRRPPNILTIALKRFQSGRFGKLNKRVSFPETLDLSPYMSEVGDDGDVYKLYAVVVHVDMLNASYFGHYICYTKDFSGNWYKIDDCKVSRVELEEVLSQGAYMLLYSRVRVRPSCSNPMEPARKHEEKLEVAQVVLHCAKQTVENSAAESINITAVSSQTGPLLSDTISQEILSGCEEELSSITDVKEDLNMVNLEVSSSVSNDVEVLGSGCSNAAEVSVSDLESPHGPIFEASTSTITETYVLEAEPPIPVFNVESKNGDNGSSGNECVIIDSQVSSTGPSKNGVCENGKAFHDGSIAISSTCQVLDEAYPFSSSGNAEKVESGKSLPSSLGTDDAAGKKDGREFSGSTSKPLFPPGFLGKRPWEKYSDQEAKTAAEIGELASACNLNCQSNGFTKRDLSHSNEGDFGDQEPHFPSDFREKQTVNSKDEDQMVTSQSSESDIPYDGGSSTPTGSCESFDIENDRSLVEEQIPLHDRSVVSLSTGEVLDEAHPFTSNGKPETVESGKSLPSSHGTDDVEGKNGGIKFSESKLKPIFPPGFLGKRPREKYSNKQEAKALEDIGELTTTAC